MPDPADSERPFPQSLCHGCRFVRYNGNKRGSIFIACDEPSLPRYQRQPIVSCRAYQEKP